MNRYLVIIPFHIPWEWSTDYPRQTAFELSRLGHVVICVLWEEALTIKEYLRQQNKAKIFRLFRKNCYVFTPIFFLPFQRIHFIRKVNGSLIIIILRFLVFFLRFRHHIHRCILWIFHPTFYTIRAYLPKDYFVVYDCVDYYSMGTKPHEADLMRRLEEKLTRWADLVVANSRVLVEHLEKIRKDVYMVPQGFRLETFRTYKSEHSKTTQTHIPPDRKPRIGYVGRIDERLDFNLLIGVVRRNPQWQFIFWGPQSHEFSEPRMKQNLKRLFAYPNVIRGESTDKNEIPAVIDTFDIGIIPYDSRYDYNRYCYPSKLFEYFYIGKPVISTSIEELRRFPEFVKFGSNPTEWERYIRKALSTPQSRNDIDVLLRIAAANSWRKKISFMLRIIQRIYV